MKTEREWAWDMCERLAELQAMLDDHVNGKKRSQDEVIGTARHIVNEDGALRAMWELKYFPPGAPPPITIADH